VSAELSSASGTPPDAAAELARLQSQVDSARVLLARLLQEVGIAESRVGKSQTAQLLQANEQLVLTALRNQTEAESAAKVLDRVSRSAERDPLTQLPNRTLMLDRIGQAIATAKRHHRQLALLFLDLNHFKQINDSLGHDVGDEVLKLMAHRLVAAVRDADTVSRYGGDEFVILLTEIGQPSDAGRIAEALLLDLAAPSPIGDQVLRLTASIGVAIYPDDGEDAATLMQRADAAMYQARRVGLGSMAFYDASVTAQTEQDRAADARMVEALGDPASRHGQATQHPQRRYADLREANERLVLATLDAQQLQAARERAHRQQAEFIALVAKELSNALAPIRLAAAMLGEVCSAEPLVPRVQSIIEKQAENIARLVAAVQAVSRAGQSVLSLERQQVDMIDAVDRAIAHCRPAMDTRLQTFTIHLPGHPVWVLGDRARLEQVVMNLVDNASQYTPDLGRIQLSLAISESVVKLTVSDSGMGIAAQALSRIYEPFAQGLPGIGIRTVGLGIGLTVVRALVEAHGGSVFAHSEGVGQGSQFIVTLPLAATVSSPVPVATAGPDAAADPASVASDGPQQPESDQKPAD
jgi:diguanylate cyclase (GGDEF)-like protein